jgi:hypothetical protein
MAGSLRICTVAALILIGASPVPCFVGDVLVQDVGLVVEVDAAMGHAGDRPHQIPQKSLLPRSGDLRPLPGASACRQAKCRTGSSLKSPIACTGVSGPCTSRTR